MSLFGPPNIEILRNKKNVKGLMKALRHNYVRIRRDAAAALVEIGSEAVEPLISLLADRDAELRWLAADIIGRIGDSRGIDPLISALKDEDRSVQGEAKHALRRFGNKAVEPLINVLSQKEKNTVFGATEVLRDISDVKAVDALISVAEDRDIYWLTREIAIEALGKIGDKSAVESLLAVLRDKKSGVVNAAIKALGNIGDGRAAGQLSSILIEENFLSFGSEIVEALDKLRFIPPDPVARANYWIIKNQFEKCVDMSDLAVESLLKVLSLHKRINADKIIGAARTLGIIGNEQALIPLLSIVEDKENPLEVREAAAKALGLININKASEKFIANIHGNNHTLRNEAVQILDWMNWEPSKDETGALYCILKADWKSCVKVGKIATEFLINAYKNSTRPNNNEGYIIKTMGEIGDVKAFDLLIDILNDQDAWYKRILAAEALGKLGDSRAIIHLHTALDDQDWKLRQAAVISLDNLNWQPTNDSTGAKYWIVKSMFDKCIDIGKDAIRPLEEIIRISDMKIKIFNENYDDLYRKGPLIQSDDDRYDRAWESSLDRIRNEISFWKDMLKNASEKLLILEPNEMEKITSELKSTNSV